LCLSTVALAAPKKDATADVQATLDKVAEAFNKSDAKAAAALFTDDATVINPVGDTGTNRDGVEKIIAQDLGTILKGGQSKFTVQKVRQVSPNAVWVD